MYTLITNSPIVDDVGWFIGATWGDFDRNGFLDLFIIRLDGRTNVFYLNNGNGTFTKSPRATPSRTPTFMPAPRPADYDNDG